VYAGGDGEDEDLYQEILMEAWKALPSFRGDSSFSTWVYRVALNTALTWRRRIARRQDHRAAMTARMDVHGQLVRVVRSTEIGTRDFAALP
jgi:RNA polymerase sigma factor (sigma-70 family)